MKLLTKAEILLHILRWRLTWDEKDLDFKVDGLDPKKFITARQAAKLIEDGSVVFSSGMAGNSRCSVFFWALRELVEKTGHPRDLTWIVVGAQGSRGRVPGTLEELNKPGIVTRFIAGHLETVKALLRLGDEGHCELHTLPQGVQTFLLEAQARGEMTLETEAGVGTFLDPRVGGGSYVGGAPLNSNFVEVGKRGKLVYHMPPINYSLFVAPYADREGNIYKRHSCTMTESYEGSLAAKANGGTVIASVCDIIEKNEAEIFLPADKVDHIVINPYSEQTGSIYQRRYWPMFTVEHKVDVEDAVNRLRFANDVLKITPVRTPVEQATARMAATLFTKIAKKGALVNVGVGLGEEVSRLMYVNGLHKDVTFFTETGVLGGLPTPGIFFGAAISPEKIITSAQIFHHAYEHLDATVLGFLEVDSLGNANLSRRGPRCIDYVGPGGMPDLVCAANTIVFVGSWMNGAKMTIKDGRMHIDKPGDMKFRDRVAEISFNGAQAIKKGKKVFFACSVGLFELTERGMTLRQVMPGIDIQEDIIAPCKMKVVLPDGPVPVVPREVVTGEGFKLAWPEPSAVADAASA